MYDAIVIGAGQAGLAAGYFLSRAGASFMMLEGAAEIGDSWRRRWDSLRLFTPARYNGLPGMAFPGHRYALPGKDDVASYLQAYATRFSLPIQTASRVTALERDGERFIVRTADADLVCSSVVVTTGAYQRPFIPEFASQLSKAIVQLHSSEYRNPSQLPDGGVLVVGAGNSGTQIALELAASRRVWLSGRNTGTIPRRLLGRDIYDWLWPTLMRPSVKSWIGRRLTGGQMFAGDPVIGLAKGEMERSTVTRTARTAGERDGHPVLEDGTALPEIAAVIWCTGFRPNFSWINLPVFGADGYPTHRRGLIDAVPGLGFLGLRYQHRFNSSLLGGVGADAEFVVSSLMK
ncbi:MAG: flavin-containing monooxygenase [Thermoanaerobaculia bacterium]